MPQPFSLTSLFDLALEIHRRRKGINQSTRLWSWKVKLLIGFSIILAVICLMVSFMWDSTKTTKILRSVKTKRFIKADDCVEESENTETVRNDIHINPEVQLEEFSKRANQHPNHRYLEIKPEGNIYDRIIEDVYEESALSPKPFAVTTEEYLSGVRNIISKKKPKGKNPRSKFPNPKTSGSSNRNSGTENFYHPKEINNLVQSNPGVEGEKNTALKKAFKSHGAPFRVPLKERGRLNMYRSSSQLKQLWFKNPLKKKPLTILLDVYQMDDNDDYFKKKGPKLSQVVKPLQNKVSKMEDIHSAGKFLFSQEGRNGIIMRLNIYPKDKVFSGLQNSDREAKDGVHENDGKRVKKKWIERFSTKNEKQQEAKECSLMALEPHRKHVTAKWKNENGEWVHAKHVSVKYLK